MKIIYRISKTWSKTKRTHTSQPTWNPNLREPTWNSPWWKRSTKIWLPFPRKSPLIYGNSSMAAHLIGSSTPYKWDTTTITLFKSNSTLLAPSSSLPSPNHSQTPSTCTSSRNTSISNMGRGYLTSVSKRKSGKKRVGRRVRSRLLRRRRKRRRRRVVRSEH